MSFSTWLEVQDDPELTFVLLFWDGSIQRQEQYYTNHPESIEIGTTLHKNLTGPFPKRIVTMCKYIFHNS